MKSELFAQILNAVSQITELTPDQILSKTKTDDLVAARSLFVHHCKRRGMPSIEIAQFIQRARTNSVNRYLNDYDSFHKSSQYFREMDDRIGRLLASCA